MTAANEMRVAKQVIAKLRKGWMERYEIASIIPATMSVEQVFGVIEKHLGPKFEVRQKVDRQERTLWKITRPRPKKE